MVKKQNCNIRIQEKQMIFIKTLHKMLTQDLTLQIII